MHTREVLAQRLSRPWSPDSGGLGLHAHPLPHHSHRSQARERHAHRSHQASACSPCGSGSSGRADRGLPPTTLCSRFVAFHLRFSFLQHVAFSLHICSRSGSSWSPTALLVSSLSLNCPHTTRRTLQILLGLIDAVLMCLGYRAQQPMLNMAIALGVSHNLGEF